MDLMDYIPFQCVKIYLDNNELYPADPKIKFLIFFVNVNTEQIKIFCSKKQESEAVCPREISISWDYLKNVTISEGTSHCEISFDFINISQYKKCDLIVGIDVLDKLEATLSLMLVRIQGKRYGRSEKEARESICVLSTVEDTDFDTDEDNNIRNIASTISSSIQTIEENSAEIFAADSGDQLKSHTRTPYVVEDTPPDSQTFPDTNIIPCTPGESDISTNIVVEDTPDKNRSSCSEETEIPETDFDVVENSVPVKFDVISVNQIKDTVQIIASNQYQFVYYDDFFETPEVAKTSPEKIHLSQDEELILKKYKRSCSLTETPEKCEENNNESQTIEKMLLEDDATQINQSNETLNFIPLSKKSPEIEENPKKQKRLRKKRPTTPSKSHKKPQIQTKKRFADSDSDEWTPHGIIKNKKLRKTNQNFEEESQKDSFFSAYSRGINLTKTRTRVVTRSNRFCDEMNYFSEIESRRKVLTESRNMCVQRRNSMDNTNNTNKTDKTKNLTRSSTLSPEIRQKSRDTCIENLIQQRNTSMDNTDTDKTSTPSRPRRRRLSHTPKFVIQEQPDKPKCSLHFAFVENENAFEKSFKKILTETENHPRSVIEPEIENVQTQSGSEISDININNKTKKPYKPFPIFTSESSNYNYSSPESPETPKKLPPVKRQMKKTKTKRCALKRIENKLPSRCPTPEPDTSKINELHVQPYMFQEIPNSQENDIDIARREIKLKELVEKVKNVNGKHITEKQFYLLAIEVFTMCVKCIHNLKDLKNILLFNFNKIYCQILKLAIIK